MEVLRDAFLSSFFYVRPRRSATTAGRCRQMASDAEVADFAELLGTGGTASARPRAPRSSWRDEARGYRAVRGRYTGERMRQRYRGGAPAPRRSRSRTPIRGAPASIGGRCRNGGRRRRCRSSFYAVQHLGRDAGRRRCEPDLLSGSTGQNLWHVGGPRSAPRWIGSYRGRRRGHI